MSTQNINNSESNNFSVYNGWHHWNALLCPPIGFALNSLFIWLIWKKTPKEMFQHSMILLQTCFFDILFLAILTIALPLFTTLDDMNIVFYQGYLFDIYRELFGNGGLFAMYFIYASVFLMQIFSICLQFIYRYLLFNRNIKITWIRYLQMLFFQFLCVCGYQIFYLFQNLEALKASQDTQFLEQIAVRMELSQSEKRSFTISAKSDRPMYMNVLYVVYAVSYTIVFVLGWRMIALLRSHIHINESRRRHMYLLTVNLFLIAAYPLLIMATEIVFFNSLSLLPNNGADLIGPFGLALNLMEVWIPIFNPVISILTNTPYRNAVFRIREPNSAQLSITKVTPVQPIFVKQQR